MSTPEQPQVPSAEPTGSPLTPAPEPGTELTAEGATREVTPDEIRTDEAPRRDRDDRTPSSDAFPVPTGPRTTGFGGHVLGILVGFALALVAGFFLVLGQSRILAQGVGRSDVTPETLGIVLVSIGVLVAGAIVLAGVWTPTAPLTGGLVLIALGAAYLFAPYQAHRETVRLIATEQNRLTVVNSITAATTGGLFLTGILLLAAATALSLVRRRGLALGAFREQARES
jgi:hypothetical protein